MTDKMTAEQALDFLWLESQVIHMPTICHDEAFKRISRLRQALSAPRVPDGWRVAISKYGLEISGPDGKITEARKPNCRWGDTDPVVYEFLSGFLLAASPEPVAPAHPDDIAVDRFAEAMKAKLASARAKGRSGWDDPEQCTVAHLATQLAFHTSKGNAGNFIDVANFAMMLHQRGADPAVMPAASMRFIEHLRAEVEALKEQWAVVFDGHAVMQHMQAAGQYAHPPLICATLDAVAAIGKERAASLREGGGQ